MTEPDVIDPGFVPRARPEVATVELDGEAVLYDERSGTTHVLNPTGTVVWSLFDGKASLGQLAAELADAYQTPLPGVEADVLALARRLGASGLLVGVEADPDPGPEAAGDDAYGACVDG